MGHEEQFPPRRLNGRYGLRKRYFAGLDVSLEETALCVVDETGRVIKEVRAASEPGPLPAALQGTGLLLERIGLKACSLTAWLPIFRHPPKASEISPIGKALVLSEGAFPPRRPTLGCAAPLAISRSRSPLAAATLVTWRQAITPQHGGDRKSEHRMIKSDDIMGEAPPAPISSLASKRDGLPSSPQPTQD